MSSAPRNSISWDHQGEEVTQSGRLGSAVADEGDSGLEDGEGDEGDDQRRLRGPLRRRSSVTNRLAAMADIGGVNSFRSFVRSWRRATSFAEVIPRRPSFILASEAEAVDDSSDWDTDDRQSHVGGSFQSSAGFLRQHLRASSPRGNGATPSSYGRAAGSVLVEGLSRTHAGEQQGKDVDPDGASDALLGRSPSTRSSIFAVAPHLATPDVLHSSLGSRYGTMNSARFRSRSSATHHGQWGVGDELRDAEAVDTALGEENPILVKEVQQGDKVVLAVEGQSTLPQSVFNSINALIGVGLLSLPLAFKLSGWIIGLLILTLTAAVTAHTGNLLAKCMEYDPSIVTYSDLAYVAFGTRARIIVSALFSLELIAACVALVILFSDSLSSLLAGLASGTFWKCVCAALVLVLNTLPLRFLSYTSVLGIFSTFCVVCIVIIDGLVKKEAPGSLWEPAKTHLLPSNWLAVPLAYGLLASPWGAHSIFPSYALDTCLAVIGILMFGDGIKDAITSNILRMSGYPESLSVIMCIFITVIPLTKIPLNARPLITTIDVVCGVYKEHAHPSALAAQPSTLVLGVRALIRVVVVLVLLGISILFPAFDSVCAFLGAALCSLISIILPISFYLKLYHKDITKRERAISWLLLVVFSILGLIGTIWTFLPKHLIGA
ncbi:hypothetical protein E4U42_006127 [Claviceps africana]|uniref:Amino acid transporter transmembrane domain-containing protein n=1 Tax=Claviceps africana TaxID=83212 RepID=A0A8K0JHB8_9HYPO|nr:hypothetical protein E4U42_006127 [Claviceps africana]